MTQAEFRAVVDAALPPPGTTTYFVDHRDGSVYMVMVWANQRRIAVDAYWTRDHPQWREELTIACTHPWYRETTVHWPRST